MIRCNSLVNRFAAQVIRSSTREIPADRALHSFFKDYHNLSSTQTAQISRAVFAYYRWHGWLSNERGLERRIERARELARRFERNPFSLPAESLRAKAVPAWVADEMEISDAWLRMLQREPLLWLRAKAGQGRALAKKLKQAKRGPLPDSLVYLGKEDLFRHEEFLAGNFQIQDISSQVVGLLCGPKPGEKWWDACSGEGGKMLHLAEQMQGSGLIIATDRSARRLTRLKQRAARAGIFNYQTAQWQGDAPLPGETLFDGVLVDAPCSGLGTWQRNPHARWTTTPQDVLELAAVQRKLLDLGACRVKPGGRLVYSVCTLTRLETELLVEEFNQSHADFKPNLIQHPFVRSAPAGRILIWPQQSQGGGMFIGTWTKEARADSSDQRGFPSNVSSSG